MIDTQLTLLREKMQALKIDAVIFPSNDPHQSEYVSDFWKIREHFSGFSGSAGTLVVTMDEAALWTDSRYFLQVEQECSDSAVELHKQTIPHAPEHVEWLCSILNSGNTIGLDYRLFSCGMMDYITSFTSKQNIQLADIPSLVEDLWKERPTGTNAPIVDHPLAFCGESRTQKLQRVTSILEKHNADYLFVSGLDELAWLFNIRSSDVDFTPLVTGYALVGHQQSTLFADKERFDASLLSALSDANVTVEPYDSVSSKLNSLAKESVLLTDAGSLNYACRSAFQGTVVFEPSYIRYWKSVKNSTEISNAKDGMRKDGIALTRFFIWLEKYLTENTITEFELGKKLEEFRKKQDHYKGESFAAIAGYKGNGAIIHYTAPENGSAVIKNEGILLLDSGAQYENATTDITRTVWLGGTPPDEIKKAYTLVLKGYISLETLRFPKGVVGMQLDAFARMHLWKHGMNYGHGTGHGIGAFSMVHEPGQGFASTGTTGRGTTIHEENQLTTIEPGFYKENEFGIRIENVALSKVTETNAFGTFLGFEPITLCPIDTQLIDQSLMNKEEIEWLNNYHQHVLDTLSPELTEDESSWLHQKCIKL